MQCGDMNLVTLVKNPRYRARRTTDLQKKSQGLNSSHSSLNSESSISGISSKIKHNNNNKKILSIEA